MDFRVASDMCLQKRETYTRYCLNYFVTQEIQILRDCFGTNCSYASVHVFLSLNEDKLIFLTYSSACLIKLSMCNVWL